MIDQRINDSLKELEQGLKNIDSARKQVERTALLFGIIPYQSVKVNRKKSFFETLCKPILLLVFMRD